jgi:hypothetical protein
MMVEIPEFEKTGLDEQTWDEACLAASSREVDHPDLLRAQETLAACGRWDGVYILSVLAGLETSVLIDADRQIFIDWGTAGQVQLQPPVGAKSPFKLWVHTHPDFAAYWSSTDTNSLSLGTGILETAMVLGEPGPKFSSNSTFDEGLSEPFIAKDGPLSNWTNEEPTPWYSWYANNNIVAEVNA